MEKQALYLVHFCLRFQQSVFWNVTCQYGALTVSADVCLLLIYVTASIVTCKPDGSDSQWSRNKTSISVTRPTGDGLTFRQNTVAV